MLLLLPRLTEEGSTCPRRKCADCGEVLPLLPRPPAGSACARCTSAAAGVAGVRGPEGGVSLLLECWRFVNVDSSVTNRKKEYVMDNVSETNTRPMIPVKGSLVAVAPNGNMLEMWFQSPDGDSSDSQMFAMRCMSPEQAQTIATLHRSKWGVPDWSKVS